MYRYDGIIGHFKIDQKAKEATGLKLCFIYDYDLKNLNKFNHIIEQKNQWFILKNNELISSLYRGLGRYNIKKIRSNN